MKMLVQFRKLGLQCQYLFLYQGVDPLHPLQPANLKVLIKFWNQEFQHQHMFMNQAL
jgi:hypothetical protein